MRACRRSWASTSPAISRARSPAAARLLRERPDMPLTLFHLAHLERENGNLESAIDALRKAIAIVPDNAETVAMLGASLTQAGRPAEAVALLDPFARREHADLEVLTARALALAKLRRFDEALAALSRARTRGSVQRTAAPRGGHDPPHGRTTRSRARGLESRRSL